MKTVLERSDQVLSNELLIYAVAICPVAGQIAFQTIFCYLSVRRTNSRKWSKCYLSGCLYIRFESYLTCSCRHVIRYCSHVIRYCNLTGYHSNLVGTEGGGVGCKKYEDIYIQVSIAFND